jgi:hypothetical protein
MTVIFSLIPLLVMILLFSWFYRIASRRVLGYSVAWKLVLGFLVVGVALGMFLSQFLPFESRPVRLVFGATAQLLVGAYVIGTFAVNKERVRPGFALGLKTTAVSMGLQAAVLGALFMLVFVLKANAGST